ncbi:gamma-glutamyltransferase family protein, partial [Desulfovibrio sp. OttesenSCG-928-C06]|nr:gamma-glutamyltransferase family protein [Desulfovibrio sp. OttesenSCG-928-C06]
QGRSIAAELADIGAPITVDDLRAQHALLQQPLETRVNGITAREAQRLREIASASGKACGSEYFQGLPIISGGESRIGGARIFNCPPPSQGISSLLILGIYDALANGKPVKDEFELVHRIAECTKLAFKLRDSHLADPAHMRESVQAWLESGFMSQLAGKIDPQRAMPWGTPEASGDTVWFGVIDQAGRTVSCIQSIYFEFGTGVVLPDSGITWHNRGLGFSLDRAHPNRLGPRKRPFHTLNPALALFDDGRVMPYGTMGGEGQPQTQAAVFSRYAWQGLSLAEAISAPRWLLGRSWGEASASLKLEADFGSALIEALRQAGHMVEEVPAQNSLMGHAGALVLHNGHEDPRRGQIQGAADPRSDGLAACW